MTNPANSGPKKRQGTSRNAWLYIIVTCAAAAASVLLTLRAQPIALGGNALLFAVLGALAGARLIEIGDRVHLSASHPFLFAALILDGPIAAIVVNMASIGSAFVWKSQPMRPFQVVFNIGATTLSTTLSWLVYSYFEVPTPVTSLELSLPAVVVTSIAFFVFNSWLVSIAVGLVTGESMPRAWYEKALWSAPSFLAGGVLGLLIAHLVTHTGTISLVLALPFSYLIYYSYRLYMDRLKEKKRRIDVVERLNADLERKVRERTEELLLLNEKLQNSNSQLSAASKLKSEFLANMSHELRTPLNAILGFSELLLQNAAGPLNEKQADFMQDIYSSGKSLMQLINEVLDLAKIEAGRMRLHIEDCTAVAVVTEAMAMVRVLASNKSVKLELAETPEVVIQADPARFRQILWNLLSNAIKFTPAGGTVTVSLRDVGNDVCLTVKDTGIGIPPEELGRLFSEFYQVDGSYSRQQGGTGLGLALVKKFVELHGGGISVRSTVDVGSSFDVVLPKSVSEDLAATSSVAVPTMVEPVEPVEILMSAQPAPPNVGSALLGAKR